MSATGRTEGIRDASDFYQTPKAVTRAILKHLPVAPAFDPCAGRGKILEVVADEWGIDRKKLAGFELDAKHAKAAASEGFSVACVDALVTKWPSKRRALCVMNPPYRLASDFVMRAIEHVAPARGTVAALLRVGFLGSSGRVAFHRMYPADVYILSPRPSFVAVVKCKSEASRCGWREIFPLDAARPKACPLCGSRVDVTTTDATEYCWAVWAPGRGGRWFSLPWSEET